MNARAASIVVAVYFALVWALLTEQHRIDGAALIVIVGVFAGWLATRARSTPGEAPLPGPAPVAASPTPIDARLSRTR